MSKEAESLTEIQDYIDSIVKDLLSKLELVDIQKANASALHQTSSNCRKFLNIFCCTSERGNEEDQNVQKVKYYAVHSPRNISCWLEEILEANSDEDIVIFDRWPKLYTTSIIKKRKGSQTDPIKVRLKRLTIEETQQLALRKSPCAPCEQTKQTVVIEALSYPTPHVLRRPPLMDRFCYMLTDFASALYLGVALMCCCTVNMLVQE